MSSLTEKDRQAILRRNQGKCGCGERAREVDHILPRALGGGNEPFNLQSLCRKCHRQKTIEVDNAHIHEKYAKKETRYERRERRRWRAVEYEAHINDECEEPLCGFCSGDVHEEKKQDDDDELDEKFDELACCFLGLDHAIFEDRIGIVLGYMLYSNDRAGWIEQACKYVRTDSARATRNNSEARIEVENFKSALRIVLLDLEGTGPGPTRADYNRFSGGPGYSNPLSLFWDEDTETYTKVIMSKVREAKAFYESQTQLGFF